MVGGPTGCGSKEGRWNVGEIGEPTFGKQLETSKNLPLGRLV
jgi:hypothetical protein